MDHKSGHRGINTPPHARITASTALWLPGRVGQGARGARGITQPAKQNSCARTDRSAGVPTGPERDEVLKETASRHVIRPINHQGKAFVRRFGQGFTCRPEAQKRVRPLSHGMGPLPRAESQISDRVPGAARAKGLDIHPDRMTAADDASQPAARMGDREERGSAPANIHGNRDGHGHQAGMSSAVGSCRSACTGWPGPARAPSGGRRAERRGHHPGEPIVRARRSKTRRREGSRNRRPRPPGGRNMVFREWRTRAAWPYVEHRPSGPQCPRPSLRRLRHKCRRVCRSSARIRASPQNRL